MFECVIVIHQTVLKSNLWWSIELFRLSFKHIAKVALGMLYDKQLNWRCVCVCWCLTFFPQSGYWSTTCATRLCVQVVTHIYLKNAFIYKGHNVVVLTERVADMWCSRLWFNYFNQTLSSSSEPCSRQKTSFMINDSKNKSDIHNYK